VAVGRSQTSYSWDSIRAIDLRIWCAATPGPIHRWSSHHDLATGKEKQMLTVYVPADAAAEVKLGIKPGSGIVGSVTPSGQIRIDYEGGLFPGSNDEYAKYETRSYGAAAHNTFAEGKGYPTRRSPGGVLRAVESRTQLG